MNGNLLAILEGLLFVVGDEGISLETCANILELPAEEVEKSLDELTKKYLSVEYGIEVVRYAGVYKFVSKALVHPYAERLFSLNKVKVLSASALETLAIVAYKQPITRVEIEEIRGVGCDMMLRKLQARDLIQEAGRSDAPGRPILYEVTQEFLDVFKLISLNELPELPSFEQAEEQENLFE